jgi:hypothetical protein
MAPYVPEILLWLFVINLGIAFGAGLYEQRIVLPQWFNSSSEPGLRVNSAAMRNTDTGRRFWAFVSTGPLTLLTLANLVVAWESQGQRHGWWLGAAVTTLVERIATFSYFIPMAIRLMHAEALPPARSKPRRRTGWRSITSVQFLFYLGGWRL